MYYNASSIQRKIEEGNIRIYPYLEKFQGPNLYYCHLGSNLLLPQKGKLADTKNLPNDLYKKQKIDKFYDLHPGEFILAETFETFMTDTNHIIRLFNSSSLARLGAVQCAVGMINPGCGIEEPTRLTLEITNTGPFIIRLYPTKVDKRSGEITDPGTEVLKVGIANHESVQTAYDDWVGALYGTDKTVAGSKIDRRFT